MDLRRFDGDTDIRKAVFVQSRKGTKKKFLLVYSESEPMLGTEVCQYSDTQCN